MKSCRAMHEQIQLTFNSSNTPKQKLFREDVLQFRQFKKETVQLESKIQLADGTTASVPVFVNEFWTAKQRAAHSLHEISYRACFKPQLARFFIERLTLIDETVYDPFMGRGTTLLEAALFGRVPAGCDVNPLSLTLIGPRLRPPHLEDVRARLAEINLQDHDEFPEDLLVFYHPETLREIAALKKHFSRPNLDTVDQWISLVALNRLTGHSPGFFSVYTLPPNQAVSVKSQRKINADRAQTPPRRDVVKLILKKSRILLSDCDDATRVALSSVASRATLVNGVARATPQIADNSVSLVVTSPPFLDVVDYAGDNWLRCWFLGFDAKSIQITIPKKLELWQKEMTAVFHELRRVLRAGGHVAFEVGEVRGGTIKLEETVIRCGVEAGLKPLLTLINDQKFTKTANCWGVNNNSKGTNTNRIVLFQK
ncbi:MAG TPA: DNA methyltransferase [Verrucomicrobiae bacterium]|nr:DNA methyltransferase [Verrucomicrobiae bacterium]